MLKRLFAVILLISIPFITVLSVSYDDFVLFNDFDKGFEFARKLDKNVLLFFTSSSCIYCAQMKEDVLPADNVAHFLINNYIVVELQAKDSQKGHFDVENAKYDPEGKEYSYQEMFGLFGVRGVPASAFFNRKLEYLGVLPGLIKEEQFMGWLKYIDEEAFRDEIEFQDYEEPQDFEGELTIKSIDAETEKELGKYYPAITKYWTFEGFKEQNLLTINPYKYHVVDGVKLKDVQKYINSVDKKRLFNVFVVESNE